MLFRSPLTRANDGRLLDDEQMVRSSLVGAFEAARKPKDISRVVAVYEDLGWQVEPANYPSVAELLAEDCSDWLDCAQLWGRDSPDDYYRCVASAEARAGSTSDWLACLRTWKTPRNFASEPIERCGKEAEKLSSSTLQ